MRYQAGLIGLTMLSITQGVANAGSETDLRFIIKYKTPISLITAKKQLIKSLKIPLKSMTAMAGGAYVLSLSAEAIKADKGTDATNLVLAQLRELPKIQYAVEDRIGHFKPLPEGERQTLSIPLTHDLQWDEFSAPGGVMLESVAGRRDGAWAFTTGQAAKPIVVAVLDTGVEAHPSLIDNLLKDDNGAVLGWNFAGNNRDVADDTHSWHGTHVAGTIAAYGSVMTGIGEHLKILPVKIPDASGMFYESQVINAIYWSVGADVPSVPKNPYPAKVLNMSFGVDEKPGKEIDHCDAALQEALFFVRDSGAVVAAAAGNDNRWEHYNAPAVCNATMKVASTGPQGLRAYYSNYGPGITYAAPGGDARYGMTGKILSTVKPGEGYQGSGFSFYQGTSMASPHAAGIAGLIYAVRDGAISAEEVEQIMFATTHAFGKSDLPDDACVGKKPCGHGILDANQAIQAALANYDVIFSAPKPEQIASVACEKNASRQVVDVDGVSWIALNPECRSKRYEEQGFIEQSSSGAILARYGSNKVYQLDLSAYKHCQVIGFDGVGCYY